MTAHDTQSFFTPDEFFCQNGTLLSQTYNLAQTLLHRSQADHVFVPIRSMQYLAIIERDVFWFVDSMAYAVRGDEGGRLITVSWHPQTSSGERESLTQPIDCHVIFYGNDMRAIHTRLLAEFFQAMQQIDKQYREALPPASKVSILPLRLPSEPG